MSLQKQYAIFNLSALKNHDAKLGNTFESIEEANIAFEMYAKMYKCELFCYNNRSIIRTNKSK